MFLGIKITRAIIVIQYKDKCLFDFHFSHIHADKEKYAGQNVISFPSLKSLYAAKF